MGFLQLRMLDFKRPRANAAPPLACADETREAVHQEQFDALKLTEWIKNTEWIPVLIFPQRCNNSNIAMLSRDETLRRSSPEKMRQNFYRTQVHLGSNL